MRRVGYFVTGAWGEQGKSSFALRADCLVQNITVLQNAPPKIGGQPGGDFRSRSIPKILGVSGTGKEVFAKMIYFNSFPLALLLISLN